MEVRFLGAASVGNGIFSRAGRRVARLNAADFAKAALAGTAESDQPFNHDSPGTDPFAIAAPGNPFNIFLMSRARSADKDKGELGPSGQFGPAPLPQC